MWALLKYKCMAHGLLLFFDASSAHKPTSLGFPLHGLCSTLKPHSLANNMMKRVLEISPLISDVLTLSLPFSNII